MSQKLDSLLLFQRTQLQFPTLILCSSQPLVLPWTSTYMCHAHTETCVCTQIKVNLKNIFPIKNLHGAYRKKKRVIIFLITQAHRTRMMCTSNLFQGSGKTFIWKPVSSLPISRYSASRGSPLFFLNRSVKFLNYGFALVPMVTFSVTPH